MWLESFLIMFLIDENKHKILKYKMMYILNNSVLYFLIYNHDPKFPTVIIYVYMVEENILYTKLQNNLLLEFQIDPINHLKFKQEIKHLFLLCIRRSTTGVSDACYKQDIL